MDEDRLIAVSPRHSVLLAREYMPLVEKPPSRDFVVRTVAKREAGSLPLMTADIVIAGYETRSQYPLAATYPLHFRKTYYPGRLHGDPKDEFENLQRASELIGLPPPIGHAPREFRSCLIPGKPYDRVSPFGVEPEESNLGVAQKLPLASAAGLWRLLEEGYERLTQLHAAGLAHGDAELHNFIVCPSPLELLLIDFESAVMRDSLADDAWTQRCVLDLQPLLREAIFLQCTLGPQAGPLAERSAADINQLFRAPERFKREIGRQVASH